MNDKLIIENLLLILKSNTEVFVHGTLESSNEEVRKVMNKCLDETLKSQYRIYETMCDYDWYKIDNINPSDINKIYEKIVCEN